MKNESIVEVYHAGTDIVEKPLCDVSRKNLDFGQGFYLTDIYDQAVNFARAKSVNRKKPPVINVYLLRKTDLLREARNIIFDSYDENWLDFIVACRTGRDVSADYDYVEGGVANDRVIDTINLYMRGFIPKERALRALIYLKPNNQICILNQAMADRFLEFQNYLKLEGNGIL